MLMLEIVLWITAGFYLLTTARMIREVLDLRLLPPPADDGDVPSVTVVVPVRDGVDEIEPTVRGMLSQTGVTLRVVIVDDRSTDGTGELVDGMAAEDDRVTALHVVSLPEGWLGKCHAIQIGCRVVETDWILLADADLRMQPNTIRRAIELARREDVQHVAAMFRPSNPTTLGEACWLNFALAALNSDYGGVNRDRTGAFGGIGAFNLVRTDVFREVGGYEPLRLTVCDDSRISKLLRAHGYRTRLFVGPEVTAHWGNTVWENVKLLEKNFFAAAEYHTAFALTATFLLILFPWAVATTGAALAGTIGSLAGLSAFLGLMSSALPAAMLAAQSGGRRWVGPIASLVWPVLAIAMLNSTRATLRQGGIRWRDTFYPLADLRRGTYV